MNTMTKDEFLNRYVAEYTDGSFMFVWLRVSTEERIPCVGEHTVGVTAYAEFQEWDTEDHFEKPSQSVCLRHLLMNLDYGPRDVLTEHRVMKSVPKPYLQVLSEDHRLGRYEAIAEGWTTLWRDGDAPLRDHTVGGAL